VTPFILRRIATRRMLRAWERARQGLSPDEIGG
jgi:hypothetical protein